MQADSSPPFRRFLWWTFLIGAVAAFASLCAFKILDRDFWWHITAGKLMWDTGHLIQMEPFAYTRAGLPYLATHEWLAHILYAVYAFGGIRGVLALRAAMMTLVFLLLLAIDWKRVWPNALLAVTGAAAVAGTFLERRQLFTFAIVAAELLLALHFLDRASRHPEPVEGRRDGTLRRVEHDKTAILAGMLALQILWVNLHGAAALVGFLIVGSLLLQRTWDLRRAWTNRSTRSELLSLVALDALFVAALFASPNGLGTIDYLYRLLTDKTIAFISEWRPREHGYALYLGPLWAAWIVSLVATRKHVVFCSLVAGVTGYLSLTAVRHEPLFVFCAVAVTIHQLKHAARWQEGLDRLARRPVWAITVSALAAVPVAAFALSGYRQVVASDNLWGYGVFAPAAGAADFVEREDIRGNLFNTYGIGGYLIHRFFPDPTRRVFIDGRNVDYGFDFMNAAFVAGHTPEQWKAIEDKWKLTYALIDYDAIKQPGWLSYSHVLDADPSWPMVYIDDWTAVYLKDIPRNRPVIDRQRFRLLTVEGLEFKTVLQKPKDQWPALEAELRRAMDDSPGSVKAANVLAMLLLREGKAEEALALADRIEQVQPRRPEAWALRAAVASQRQEWKTADGAFARMLSLAGDDYPDINYGTLAQIAARAGNARRAELYRALALAHGQTVPKEQTGATLPAAQPSPRSFTGSLPSSTTSQTAGSGAMGDLLSGMQDDIEHANEDGIERAGKGDLAGARASFLRALMLDPGNPLTLSNLCALSVQEGKIDEAIAYGERGLGRGADFADLHYNLALAYARAGNKAKATLHAKRAQKLGRDSSDILSLLR